MSAEPQNHAQAVPKHLERKMMLATARNDDLEDPEAVKALRGKRAHRRIFIRATDWRYPQMARKAPRKHDEQPQRRQKRAPRSSGGGRSAVQRA